VRYYQRRGLLPDPRPHRTGLRGTRHYGPDEARRLRFIRTAQAAGFTLEEIAELLRLDSTGDRPRAREMAGARIAALALAVSFATFGTPFTVRTAEWFIAFAMAILALLKLQDLDRFATMFLGYDLLARRWVPYAYIYPFAEAAAGVLMAGRALNWLSIPIALFIGTVGAVSVFYAVYVQRRELKCACVGGSSRVPLGFVSLTENVMMVAMAVWMVVSHG
jgi:DNA-binding transcriptional MerR regulator